jgi:hypothetical protein
LQAGASLTERRGRQQRRPGILRGVVDRHVLPTCYQNTRAPSLRGQSNDDNTLAGLRGLSRHPRRAPDGRLQGAGDTAMGDPEGITPWKVTHDIRTVTASSSPPASMAGKPTIAHQPGSKRRSANRKSARGAASAGTRLSQPWRARPCCRFISSTGAERPRRRHNPVDPPA